MYERALQINTNQCLLHSKHYSNSDISIKMLKITKYNRLTIKL